MQINPRIVSLDKGKVPVSILTNDDVIEKFHSEVAGGEDPFSRKKYETNQAGIYYQDNSGKEFVVQSGEFMLSGIDFSYNFFPQQKTLNQRRIYTNIGAQAGFSLSKVNPALDFGLNASLIKEFVFWKEYAFHVGLSVAGVSQQLIPLGTGIELTNKRYLGSTELLLEFVKNTQKKGYISLSNRYFVQSSFRDNKEFDYLVLTGQRHSSHWHYTFSHLYRLLLSDSLIFTWAKGLFAYSIYIREDFLVDNAPDVQTGIGIKYMVK